MNALRVRVHIGCLAAVPVVNEVHACVRVGLHDSDKHGHMRIMCADMMMVSRGCLYSEALIAAGGT